MFAIAVGDAVVHSWIDSKIIIVITEHFGPCVMRLNLVAAAKTPVNLDLEGIVGIRGIAAGIGDFLCPAELPVKGLALEVAQGAKTGDAGLVEVVKRAVSWENMR